MRFERTAPVWEGPRQIAMTAKPTAKRGMAGSVQFKGQIGAAQAADFERMLQLAKSENGVKLDLVHAIGIDPVVAQQFASVLQTIRRAEQRIVVAGGKEFAQHIKDLLSASASKKKTTGRCCLSCINWVVSKLRLKMPRWITR